MLKNLVRVNRLPDQVLNILFCPILQIIQIDNLSIVLYNWNWLKWCCVWNAVILIKFNYCVCIMFCWKQWHTCCFIGSYLSVHQNRIIYHEILHTLLLLLNWMHAFFVKFWVSVREKCDLFTHNLFAYSRVCYCTQSASQLKDIFCFKYALENRWGYLANIQLTSLWVKPHTLQQAVA